MIGEPMIPVECDRCCSVEDFDLPPSEVEGLYDARNLEATMKRAGWITTDEGDVCPTCAEAQTDETDVKLSFAPYPDREDSMAVEGVTSWDIPDMAHMQGGPEN